jgi:hypothetical protein
MSEDLSIKRILLSAVLGYLLLWGAVYRVVLGGPLSTELFLASGFFALIFYLLFVPVTLFFIFRGNFRVRPMGAFLIGFLQCLIVLLMVFDWQKDVPGGVLVLPLVAGLIGIAMAWTGKFLRFQ